MTYNGFMLLIAAYMWRVKMDTFYLMTMVLQMALPFANLVAIGTDTFIA